MRVKIRRNSAVREKSVTQPFCPLQIPHGLAWD